MRALEVYQKLGKNKEALELKRSHYEAAFTTDIC
jgi:hypothetical protein